MIQLEASTVPAHDLELWKRAVVPVLDLAKDRLDILGHRPFPLAGVLKDRKMPSGRAN